MSPEASHLLWSVVLAFAGMTTSAIRVIRNSRLVVAALALPVTPAFAADCRQEDAIYSDREGAYELRFASLGSEAAAASNRFKMSIAKTPIVMDGYVMRSEDPERSHGILLFNCPEGDATGADLDACTVWQDIIYGLDAKGGVAVLPPEGADAADRLLLPALGPSIRESSVWGEGKATVAPWDVLTFKGCTK